MILHVKLSTCTSSSHRLNNAFSKFHWKTSGKTKSRMNGHWESYIKTPHIPGNFAFLLGLCDGVLFVSFLQNLKGLIDKYSPTNDEANTNIKYTLLK